ncbi:MAG: WGR domain-containing protein [Lamprobacter sp.]|uniref:WGR domain-containing protein n=1 Tax=Lamprobacter sp. TaxID=3100796 RepID=UPI002B25FF09|nr:WGR domain-containing protein [Lamprobacter sp.]MEA3640238.1 WGR domain-containing protein [Lamprobacter sp.]
MSFQDFEEPLTHRWINRENQRYYSVRLVQDLFGDWTLVICWGGANSKRGGMRVTPVESQEEGEEEIRKMSKRRRQHGYAVLVESASPNELPADDD